LENKFCVRLNDGNFHRLRRFGRTYPQLFRIPYSRVVFPIFVQFLNPLLLVKSRTNNVKRSCNFGEISLAAIRRLSVKFRFGLVESEVVREYYDIKPADVELSSVYRVAAVCGAREG